MEVQELIARAEQNIRTALEDYGRHTEQQDVLCDVTDTFIHRLAEDSTIAKQNLRKLFSKSPAWDPDLDAIVINGTRTHEPDFGKINALIFDIFMNHIDNRSDCLKFHRVRKYFAMSKEERESDYYNAHTLYEYIDFGHLGDTINRVLEIVEESPNLPQYQYIERETPFWPTGYYSSIKYPRDIEDEYVELLDFYSEEELEEIRNELGDNGIHQLFQYEFGGTQYENHKGNNLKRF